MSDIFISYKHEDILLAKTLAMELTGLGWTVWWDHEIPAGQDYDEVIVNELSSAKCVLVLWSERSVNSRNVKDEANVALDRKVLIPIFIGKDTRPPLGFRMIQGVKWNQNDHMDETEFDDLLRHITRLIGNSPKSKNKPAPKNDSANTALTSREEIEQPINKKTEQKIVSPDPTQPEKEVTQPNYKREEEKRTPDHRSREFKFSKVTADGTYAIVVGIGNYKDVRIPKLNYTQSDAKSFYNLLLNPAHAGLKQENVKLLLDEDATLFNLKNVVTSWLFQNAKSDSTVLIYFAGHGGLESDRTGCEKDGIAKYLLPWDCNCDNLYASALSNTQLQEILSAVQSKSLFFMDSCYASGITGKGARDMGVIEDFNKKIAEGEGRIVIASAKPNQRSWEDDSMRHGIFTYHLLEALAGKADHDNDGYVSLSEVYKYLQDNVPDSVRRLSQSIQEPILTGDLTKDVFLTANAERLKEKAEELNMKRKQLSDIYNDNIISTEIYTQSLMLLNKSTYELTDKEKRLKRNLDAFLNGGLTSETFVENWEMIIQIQEPQQKLDTNKPPSLPVQKNKFCTNCGKTIKPAQLFCTGCGKKIN